MTRKSVQQYMVENREELRRQVEELTPEKRAAALEMMRAGHTVGQVKAALELPSLVVCEIVSQYVEQVGVSNILCRVLHDER